MWIITTEDVGQIVRETRKQVGLSQQALAGKAGVTRQWIAGLERGKAGVAFGGVLRVCHVLGLRFDLGRSPSAIGTARTATLLLAADEGESATPPRRRLATRPAWRRRSDGGGESA
jgi:HTH-type transcriptional regulator/antitoxin HipB